MKASELIANAWYLSEIVARDLETVSGSQAVDGLRMLNNLLSEKRISGRYIPYYSHLTINAVVGQESYYIPDLIIIDELTFNIGPVRYPMVRDTRRRYFGVGRVDNIEALPYHYYAEREKGGMRLYLYFLPQEAYPLNITGRFALSEVTKDTDISDNLEQYYISFLEYELANRMCEFYGVPFNPQKLQTLINFRRDLVDVSNMDFTIEKDSILQKRGGLNWGDINIGKGWRP